MNLFKILFFFIHFLGILISLFGIFFYWQILFLQGVVILSWYFNDNKCLLTQFEDYFFEESIVDLYFKLIKNNKKYKKYVVPSYQRYTIYLIFITSVVNYLIIPIIIN